MQETVWIQTVRFPPSSTHEAWLLLRRERFNKARSMSRLHTGRERGQVKSRKLEIISESTNAEIAAESLLIGRFGFLRICRPLFGRSEWVLQLPPCFQVKL